MGKGRLQNYEVLQQPLLSHALAALTALVPVRKLGRGGNSARRAGRVPARKHGFVSNFRLQWDAVVAEVDIQTAARR